VALVARVHGTKVVIDWHNLGYSILALKLGDTHPLVRLAEWFERKFGRSAYAHLFVTHAMRDHLVEEWDLQCVLTSILANLLMRTVRRGRKAVLHDRPPAYFHPTTPYEMHNVRSPITSPSHLTHRTTIAFP
jgi:beta-1,4-mannosyltransferase